MQMKTEKCTAWVERDKKVLAPTQHLSYFPLVVESGNGSLIKDLDGNEFIRKLYCTVPCFTFFAPLINADGAMIRLSEYFHLFLVLLVPISVELLFNKNSQNIVYGVLIGGLSVLAIMSTRTYYFFWQ